MKHFIELDVNLIRETYSILFNTITFERIDGWNGVKNLELILEVEGNKLDGAYNTKFPTAWNNSNGSSSSIGDTWVKQYWTEDD